MSSLSLNVDFEHICGKIRPMHATNNGPIKGVGFGHAETDGFRLWREAGIPYARTHDSSFCASYGGEHTVDIHAVFPNFEADVNDPASYDFAITDKYLSEIVSCGTEVFYRLGSKIEHEVKKYNTLPPKDFQKWAEICEHVIMHYTEGFANGFTYDMQYWEIWNEPNLDPEDATDKRCWGGTAEEFYRFYAVVATHLKKRFPHLKIGGPAAVFREAWIEKFLAYLTKDGVRVPLDFFSWHCYGHSTQKMTMRGAWIRKKLDEYGYHNTESILNEWNYLTDWSQFVYCVKQIISIKGAAFTAACMCGCQNDSDIDMLMYYDASPGKYNGLFDFYTNAPLKGYYPFKMFNVLYTLGHACKCDTVGNDIYAAAAKGNGESAVMLCYFNDNDEDHSTRSVALDFCGGSKQYDLYVLDYEKDGDYVKTVNVGDVLELSPNTVCLLRSCG